MTGREVTRAAGVHGTDLVALQVAGLMALLKIIGLMTLKWPNGRVYLWGRDLRAGWFVLVFAEAEGGRNFLVTSRDLMGLEMQLNALVSAGAVGALS